MSLEDKPLSWMRSSTDTEKDKQDRTEWMICEVIETHKSPITVH